MSEAFVPVIALLVKSTLIVVAAGAAVQAMKAFRIAASTRHLVWLSAFAALALLPVLSAALPPILILLPYAELGVATHDLSIPGEHIPDRTTAVWIWIVYLLGVTVMLLRLAAARAALAALWRAARPFSASNADDLARAVGVSSAVDVRIADAPIAPLTWGARILLPPQAGDWPAARVRDVLLHELCHMARRDSLTQIMAAIVRAAFWFSPAVWFALRELRAEQEHACDERVMESGAEPMGYAQTLLDVAASSQAGPIGMGVSTAMVQRSTLERRVTTILQSQQIRLLGVAPMTGLGVVLVAVSVALAAAQPMDSARRLPPLGPLTSMNGESLAPLSPLTASIDIPNAPSEVTDSARRLAPLGPMDGVPLAPLSPLTSSIDVPNAPSEATDR